MSRINDFSVTIVGPGGESDPSPMVRYVLDQAPAKITIYSPEEGSVVNGPTIEINGKTQARATLIAHNAANGSSVSGNAATDGLFTLSLPISTGSNEITITGTDPAGNETRLKGWNCESPENPLPFANGEGACRAVPHMAGRWAAPSPPP